MKKIRAIENEEDMKRYILIDKNKPKDMKMSLVVWKNHDSVSISIGNKPFDESHFVMKRSDLLRLLK